MTFAAKPAANRHGQSETAILRIVLCALGCLAAAIVLIDVAAVFAGLNAPAFSSADRQGGRTAAPLLNPDRDARLHPYPAPAIPTVPLRHASNPAGRQHIARPIRVGDTGETAPMAFRLGPDGTVHAEGTIMPGTIDRFRQFLNAPGQPMPTRLQLHSPGGSVRDAIAIARLIRERGMGTLIAGDGYCASSCPLVFAGGIERTAHRDAWIGVHQVYARISEIGSLQQGMDEAQRISAQAQSLLLDLGVDPRLWIRAMQTPRHKVYLLTAQELTEFGLATAIIQ